MAKPVTAVIKLQCPGGQATPAPPVGPALGAHGVNIGEFVKRFNDATASEGGLVIPVVITVYGDRSFDFITKQPPAAVLIKKALGLEKGTGNAPAPPEEMPDALLSRESLREIAERKMPDLNAASVEAAMRIIAGTARSMGVKVAEEASS